VVEVTHFYGTVPDFQEARVPDFKEALFRIVKKHCSGFSDSVGSGWLEASSL
jgi:hypothetical protein